MNRIAILLEDQPEDPARATITLNIMEGDYLGAAGLNAAWISMALQKTYEEFGKKMGISDTMAEILDHYFNVEPLEAQGEEEI